MKEINRISDETTNENHLIERLMSILVKTPEKGKVRALVDLFRGNIPLIARERFILRVVHARVIHASYLHSLNGIGVDAFGGELILDQMLYLGSVKFLETYLNTVSTDKAREAVTFAASIVEKESDAIIEIFRQHPLFPSDYLQDVDVATTFSIDKIASLVHQICSAKNIEFPIVIRRAQAKALYEFLLQQVREQRITTTDFQSILEMAMGRLRIDATSAVEFFRDEIPEVADYLAYKNNMPRIDFTSNRFRNPRCHKDDIVVSQTMSGVFRVILGDSISFGKFERDLAESKQIVVVHHEQPLLIPNPSKLDLISIRTHTYVFHILVLVDPDAARRAVRILRNFPDLLIYGRSVQGFARCMDEMYGWKPVIIDISDAAVDATGKRPATMTDLAELITGGKFCWRAKIFSAHVAPSLEALRHRDYYVSIIYIFARDYIAPRTEQEEVVDEPAIPVEEDPTPDPQSESPPIDDRFDTPATQALPVSRRLFEGCATTPTFLSPDQLPRWSPMAEAPPPTRRRDDYVNDPQFFGQRREGPVYAASRRREERYDTGPFHKTHRPCKRY